MNAFSTDILPVEPADSARGGAARPKTATVIALLGVIALIFSYLIGYAIVGALAAAEVIAPISRGHDPRFSTFAISFVVLAGLFLGIGGLARHSSRRQMLSMDAMEQEAESPLST
jgi:hypothetical protein